LSEIEKHYAELKQAVLDLLDEERMNGTEEDHLYREMLLNIQLLRKEEHDIQEVRLLNKAFRELRHAMRIFKKYRGKPKAAVFGSARTPRDHDDYKIAEEFGRKIAGHGWMVITGGAHGIMEAAMRGAGSDNSFGLNILLPFEQDANPIIKGDDKLMYFKYFFTRKLMFLKESEATVLFPGGFGTFDEGFESFTLVQTGKAKPRPLVLVDPKNSSFWKNMLGTLKENMLDRGLISPNDLQLMRHYQDAGEAVDGIVSFYKNYHSSRFFKDWFLIRLKRKLTDAHLRRLNEEFRDIITKGEFARMTETAADDQKDENLERLAFFFDKSSFARLRILIDVLNTF